MKQEQKSSGAGQGRIRTGACWDMLREAILRAIPGGAGSRSSSIEGLEFHSQTHATDPWPRFYSPVAILVAQGTKSVRIGTQETLCGEGTCFICGVDMPAISCALQASAEKPYLSLSLRLDPVLLGSLASVIPPAGARRGCTCGAMAQEAGEDLVDAFVRLVRLEGRPELLPALSGPVRQEIHALLLAGPFGESLRPLAATGTLANRIADAIGWLKTHYAQPFDIRGLADLSCMARSTFHKHFKAVTAVSPLQYQKRLRLREARRLLMEERCAVAQAAFAVGYESSTQFIREYKRLYGEPPRQSMRRFQEPFCGKPRHRPSKEKDSEENHSR